jgi:large repetitive protein
MFTVLLQVWIHRPTENRAHLPLKKLKSNNVHRIIVSYNRFVSSEDRIGVLNHAQVVQNAKIVKTHLMPHMEVWEIDGNTSMWDVLKQVARLPQVAFAEPDYELNLLFGEKKKKKKPTNPAVPPKAEDPAAQPDPMLSKAYGLYKIKAPQSWNIHRGSESVTVAIIDSGMDYLHEDLHTNLWYNPGEVAGDGVDNDGNGFIDDIIGWDFRNGDAFPYDDNQHGTHCAGIIGAVGENGRGLSGVIQNVNLMPLKFTNEKGSGKTSHAIAAIEYAVQNGAQVLSNSWGGANFSQNLYQAVKFAQDNGVLFIAAAGNGGADGRGDNIDSSPTYPASYDLDNVITVAATNKKDKLEYFSNYGATHVDLGAPGSVILSTVPRGKYSKLSGTSMATPYVAGAAALLLSFKPQLSYLEIKDTLLNTTDPLTTMQGKSVSGGRLNVLQALESFSNQFMNISRTYENY